MSTNFRKKSLSENDQNVLKASSIELRKSIVSSLHASGGGHYGGCLSVIDILLLIYSECIADEMKLSASKVTADKLILSKGHAAMALYAVFARFGVIDESELSTYGQAGSRLQGHPDSTALDAIDFSTGSLGQGFSAGLGMGLALRNQGRGVWVVMGDGECQEGQVWEAAMLGHRLGLSNVWPIVDSNGFQEFGYGWCDDKRKPIVDLASKWRAFGWDVIECDGHNHLELYLCLLKQRSSKVPTVIIAHTVKGKGATLLEKNPDEAHCLELTDEQVKEILLKIK